MSAQGDFQLVLESLQDFKSSQFKLQKLEWKRVYPFSFKEPLSTFLYVVLCGKV